MRRMHVVEVGLSLAWPCSLATRVRHEAAALVQAGHQVTVVTDTASVTPDIEEELQATGARLATVDAPLTGKKGLWFASRESSFAVAAQIRLRRLARDRHVDLFVAHSSGVCAGLPLLARWTGSAATHVVHGLVRERLRHQASPYNLQTVAFYRVADALAARTMPSHIAVSEYMVDELVQIGARRDRCAVVYNPVDLTRFCPAEGIGKDIDVLYVGRLTVEKGVEDLLSALERMDDLRVVIAGDGPLRRDLETQASRLASRVEFVGRIDNAVLPELIRRAKVQAVPSPSEPFGMVVLEALACGTPVVASRTGGIPEIMGGTGAGWLVSPRDPPGLAAALRRVLDDPAALARASAAAPAVADRFGDSAFGPALIAAYEQLAFGRGAPPSSGAPPASGAPGLS